MNDAQISASSACSAATTNTKIAATNKIMVTTTSISPDTIRPPMLAGGRSSATASPVTRSSVVNVANSGTAMVGSV